MNKCSNNLTAAKISGAVIGRVITNQVNYIRRVITRADCTAFDTNTRVIYENKYMYSGKGLCKVKTNQR